MSQVDNLLDNLSEEELEAYTADPISEEHIVIDFDRFITVPESLQRIAVQFDHNVETVTFDCPRYWDGVDMLDKTIYINYMRPNGTFGMYLASEDENGTRLVTPDETDNKIMHFKWTISNYVTEFNGSLKFLVCINEVNESGVETFHWNTEPNSQMRISEGLEVKDKVIETNNDIITQLLLRMGNFEDNASEAVKEIERLRANAVGEIYALKSDSVNEIETIMEDARGTVSEMLDEIKTVELGLFNIENGPGTGSIQQKTSISAGDNSAAFGESKVTFKEGSETEYEMLVTVTKGYDDDKSTSEEIVLITEVYNDNGSVSGGNASDLLPEEQPTEAQFYRDGTQILSNYSIDFATTGSHGDYTHVEGYHSLATGIAAHAEGYDTYAAGNYSHTEGADTIAFGENSHAEGLKNTSNAQASHTEGIRNTADGKGSHVEGLKNHTSTNALFSHVEGSRNNVRSSNSHAEGINNILVGSASHAHVEGECNWVEAINAHAEGSNNTIHNAGASAHVEGDGNIVSGAYAHAEGQSGVAKGESSHVEGSHQKVYNEDGSLAYDVTVNLNSSTGQVIGINPSTTGAIGKAAHAEGFKTVSEGNYAHSEGHKSYAKGSYSHAEGQTNYAEGTAAHAEGNVTRASGEAAHAEGYKTLASGKYSHAEGSQTNATYQYSHAEGRLTKASNEASHAEGGSTTASGKYSHAEGRSTVASRENQHVQGRYNIEDTTENGYAHIVGNGTADAPSNAHTLDWYGNAWFAGDVTVGPDGTRLLKEGEHVAAAKFVDISPNINPSGMSEFQPGGRYQNLLYLMSYNPDADYFPGAGSWSYSGGKAMDRSASIPDRVFTDFGIFGHICYITMSVELTTFGVPPGDGEFKNITYTEIYGGMVNLAYPKLSSPVVDFTTPEFCTRYHVPLTIPRTYESDPSHYDSLLVSSDMEIEVVRYDSAAAGYKEGSSQIRVIIPEICHRRRYGNNDLSELYDGLEGEGPSLRISNILIVPIAKLPDAFGGK